MKDTETANMYVAGPLRTASGSKMPRLKISAAKRNTRLALPLTTRDAGSDSMQPTAPIDTSTLMPNWLTPMVRATT
jgi:hypothetical protein